MFSGLRESLLNLGRALPGVVTHRHPAEQIVEQPHLFQTIRKRPRGKEEFQLDNRTGRDDTGDKLI
ncbi:hypothetical protein Atai01_19060 [Amycolatopsis taiwanensis]|uniref:Uncharacterized protein n=1 Tax=Amycolatopsis taiwanensis TaxID=342230 RepID=A0A9W6VFA5_9PSEU|nr:hypothetical protein Atai01_19060 [Amycolatopsis taiwanensis]